MVVVEVRVEPGPVPSWGLQIRLAVVVPVVLVQLAPQVVVIRCPVARAVAPALLLWAHDQPGDQVFDDAEDHGSKLSTGVVCGIAASLSIRSWAGRNEQVGWGVERRPVHRLIALPGTSMPVGG